MLVPPSPSLCDLYSAAPGSIHRVLLIAVQEWSYFGGHKEDYTRKAKPKQKAVHEEHHTGYSARVARYWRVGTGLRYDGNDRDQAWSATFISYCMRQGGVSKRDFPRSRRHSEYIQFAMQNRVRNTPGAKFIGRRTTEYAPQVGDLVCYTRGASKMTFKKALYHDKYESHTDLVLYARSGSIGVIGGNVSQSVTLKILKTDGRGLLIDEYHDWFAVLENRLPLS